MAPMNRLSAIVLLAGASTRMEGGSKLTRPYRGKPLAAHVLDILAGLDLRQRIAVVGGPYQTQTMDLLARYPNFVVVHNPDAASGMGSSIAAGARALVPGAGVFVCLGDMPNVRAEDFRALATELTDPQTIFRQHFGDRLGHPVLFGSNHIPSLKALTGTAGAATVIDAAADSTVSIRSSHRGVTEDFDTLEDFSRDHDRQHRGVDVSPPG